VFDTIHQNAPFIKKQGNAELSLAERKPQRGINPFIETTKLGIFSIFCQWKQGTNKRGASDGL